eukprot:2391518-Rhodomonas_salina.4
MAYPANAGTVNHCVSAPMCLSTEQSPLQDHLVHGNFLNRTIDSDELLSSWTIKDYGGQDHILSPFFLDRGIESFSSSSADCRDTFWSLSGPLQVIPAVLECVMNATPGTD